MTRIFIDGKAGTTGLKIFSRFQNRPELELIQIDEDKRKDPTERAKCINDSDITFLSRTRQPLKRWHWLPTLR